MVSITITVIVDEKRRIMIDLPKDFPTGLVKITVEPIPEELASDPKTRREQLVQQIKQAFDDVEYPGDDNLVDEVEHVETLKLVLAFKGKHWKEVTSEVILQYKFDLSRFAPKAFRFYLPAYLIASLLGEDRGEIIPHVIWNLDPQEAKGNFRNDFLARVEGLSSKQKAAIKAFIKFFVERQTHLMPDDKRMQQFWENYSI